MSRRGSRSRPSYSCPYAIPHQRRFPSRGPALLSHPKTARRDLSSKVTDSDLTAIRSTEGPCGRTSQSLSRHDAERVRSRSERGTMRTLVSTAGSSTPSSATGGADASDPSSRRSGAALSSAQPPANAIALAMTPATTEGRGASAGPRPSRRCLGLAPAETSNASVARAAPVRPRPKIGAICLALCLDDPVGAVRVRGIDHPYVVLACKGVHFDRD